MPASASASAWPISRSASSASRRELRYAYEYLGAGTDTLAELVGGKGKFLQRPEEGAAADDHHRPGRDFGRRRRVGSRRAAKLAGAVGAVTADWNGFAVLHTAASRVGGLDLGFVPGEGGKTAAEMLTAHGRALPARRRRDRFLGQDRRLHRLYRLAWRQGAHGADVILPAATYTEKSGTWVNTEGRVQMGNRAGFAPGDAREDWAIIRALSDVLGKRLPFDSLERIAREALCGPSRISPRSTRSHGRQRRNCRTGAKSR